MDLVYLDPPFNSNREYAAIYEDDTGRPLPEQIDAFEDLWELSEERLRAIQAMPVLMVDTGIPNDIAKFWQLWMQALRKANPRLLAYLSYMTERLLPLRSIVKPMVLTACGERRWRFSTKRPGICEHASYCSGIPSWRAPFGIWVSKSTTPWRCPKRWSSEISPFLHGNKNGTSAAMESRDACA